VIRTFGVGRYATGEADMVCRSRSATTGQQAVLRLGGRGTTGAVAALQSGAEQSLMVERGFLVMEADWSSATHWGNPTSQARVATAKTYVQAAPYSAKAGKVCLYGRSMGGLLAVLYALANPSAVQAMALVHPAVGLIDIHDNNRGGYATEIETAYGGGAGWNAAKASHDALSRTLEYAALGIPTKVWYSPDDPIVVASVVTAWADAIDAELVDMGAIGHSASASMPAEVATFLAAHA
jgi:pimeloyl-ACP methyl ester carboxylesterase